MFNKIDRWFTCVVIFCLYCDFIRRALSNSIVFVRTIKCNACTYFKTTKNHDQSTFSFRPLDIDSLDIDSHAEGLVFEN